MTGTFISNWMCDARRISARQRHGAHPIDDDADAVDVDMREARQGRRSVASQAQPVTGDGSVHRAIAETQERFGPIDRDGSTD